MSTDKSNESISHGTAQQLLMLLIFLPLFNSTAAAAMGLLVVFSDADQYKLLAALLAAANIGGWIWWLTASFKQLKTCLKLWMAKHSAPHPGYRLASLMSMGIALSWVGVIGLLAYGMLG